MRMLHYRAARKSYRILSALVGAFVLVTGFMTFFAYADNNHENKKIHITADRLISDSEAGCAEFVGNVKATSEDGVITSDKLKIYYKKGSDKKENLALSEESIEKIVANGNVKIRFDNRVAVTQQAVYITESRILILTGTGSKVTSGNNSISGSKITLYRVDGRITVESSSEKRVEAVFYSEEKGEMP